MNKPLFTPFDLANNTLPRATPPSGESRVVPLPESAPEFTSLATLTSAHAHRPSPTPAAPEPAITVQREGDRVTGIRVTCACGQVIELACSY